MRVMLTFLLAFAALPVHSDEAASTCACINRDGQEVPLGEIACLTVGGKSFLARCAMSLNVLTWRRVQDGCVVSQAPYPFSPAPQIAKAPRTGQSHL